MSQDNVEMARRSYEAWHRGDVDAAFEDFAPDFELDMSRAIGTDRGVYSLIPVPTPLGGVLGGLGDGSGRGRRSHRCRGARGHGFHEPPPGPGRDRGAARGTWLC